MKKLLSLLGIILLLSACNSELSFSEVSKERINKDVQSFIDNAKNENGVHLYYDSQKAVYIFLNGANVKQGEKAVHFTDFDVEENSNTLNILYNNDLTADYSNQSLNHKLLYKVNLNKKYKNVRAFSNGKEVSFGVISGKH